MDDSFPVMIAWPAGANIAVIGEQWSRDDEGEILAVYNDLDELWWAIHLSQWIREWGPEPVEMNQAEMFPKTQTNYDE